MPPPPPLPLPLPAPTGPLIPLRNWTDKQGRELQAELLSASKDAQGYYQGIFRRPSGDEFLCLFSLLSDKDVQLIKQTLIEKGLYKPDRN